MISTVCAAGPRHPRAVNREETHSLNGGIFIPMTSFQIGVHQVYEVFGQLRGDLLLGSVGEVKTDMSLQHFAHQRVDAAAHRRQQHQLAAAIFVGRQRALHRVQLPAHFSQPLQQFELFALLMGHSWPPAVDSTYPRYGINPEGV